VTYSIVAWDPDTRATGVAVQSHWFSVGGLVAWAEAGVGAVATQANIEVSYGVRGLARLREGADAAAALEALLAADPHAGFRQAAIVDAAGRVAVHTGADCMEFAGHVEGAHHSCQANLMAAPGVPEAMSGAFEGTAGDLTTRLLAALDAAEATGGDVRGRQSAAILVVPGAGELWERAVDLRVEDHPDPLAELRRLVVVNDAYALAVSGDELSAAGDHAAAGRRYVEAHERLPDYPELEFWAGLALIDSGDPEAGVAHLRAVIALNPGWRHLLDRLEPDTAPAATEARRLLDAG
jgi:uncharacterized Ntn-hydrolase superfamily protein